MSADSHDGRRSDPPQLPESPNTANAPKAPRAPAVARALALFTALMRLMPRRYRQRHRDEAIALMARLLDEAHRRAGGSGVASVACRAMVDLLVRMPVEHVVVMREGFEAVRRDVWYGVRSLRRRPVSSLAAIATLAIGIGLNTSVFSVVDWVMLRPLPYPSPHELVRVSSAGTSPVSGPTPTDLTYSEFTAFSRATAFRTSVAFSRVVRVVVGQGIDPAHVVIARVAGDLFGTIGVHPEIGRAFDRREIASGAAVVVISHALWQHRFAADAAIVGRVITIDQRPHTIVGVMPAGRGYPSHTDLWRPLLAEEREDDDREHAMIARLMSGVSTTRASKEVAALAAGVTVEGGPDEGGSARRATSPRTVRVEDVQRTEVRDVRATLTALWASAALILLMTCANVAALIGARGADRTGEMAVRGALGAGRGRLLRQLLTESVLLALAGGVAGLMLGRWTLDLLVHVAPAEVPRLTEVTLDGRVIISSIVATVIVGVLVGLAPSWRASRFDLRASLGMTGSTARVSHRTSGRRVLVAAQTAIAVVLTVGAGLLARSLQHLVTIDHGFRPDRLLAVDLYLHGGMETETSRFFREAIANAEAVPGVQSAAVAMALPTRVIGLRVPVRIEGVTTDARADGRTGAGAGPRARGNAGGSPIAILRAVTPRYFETTGIPLTAGRAFAATDGEAAPGVAIVNAAFVRDILRGGPAVGVRLTTDTMKGRHTIVGVVANVTPAGEADRPAIYAPVDQVGIGGGSLLVRTDGNPATVVAALVARLRAVAPTLALDKIRIVADTIDAGHAVTRFNMRLASAFAGLALLLAAIGIYGLTAGEVSVRWRELAVRLALGATRGEALWTVMRPGAVALAVGLVAGVAATLVVGRWMSALLHGIAPADPPTLVVVPLLLGAIGVVAASAAAARVLRADPAATLRAE